MGFNQRDQSCSPPQIIAPQESLQILAMKWTPTTRQEGFKFRSGSQISIYNSVNDDTLPFIKSNEILHHKELGIMPFMQSQKKTNNNMIKNITKTLKLVILSNLISSLQKQNIAYQYNLTISHNNSMYAMLDDKKVV